MVFLPLVYHAGTGMSKKIRRFYNKNVPFLQVNSFPTCKIERFCGIYLFSLPCRIFRYGLP